jgi:hypothetical protein
MTSSSHTVYGCGMQQGQPLCDPEPLVGYSTQRMWIYHCRSNVVYCKHIFAQRGHVHCPMQRGMFKRSTTAIIFQLSVAVAALDPRLLSTTPFGIYMCSGANFSASPGSQIGPPCAWTDLRGLINQCLHLPSGMNSFGPDQGIKCTMVRMYTVAPEGAGS